jgi:hypothetical protein
MKAIIVQVQKLPVLGSSKTVKLLVSYSYVSYHEQLILICIIP